MDKSGTVIQRVFLIKVAMEGALDAARHILQNWEDPTSRSDVAMELARVAVGEANPELLALALDRRWNALSGSTNSYTGPTPMHWLTQQSGKWLASANPRHAQVPGLARIIVEAGVALRGRDGSVSHCLTAAVMRNDKLLARTLLDLGADPDGDYLGTDNNGGGWFSPTPLSCAQDLEMVRLLAESGARFTAAGRESVCGVFGNPTFLGTFLDCLPEVVATWRDLGGEWFDAMEDDQEEHINLPEYAFCNAECLAPLPAGASAQEQHQRQGERRQVHALQRAIVACGFNLDQVAEDGKSYRQHLEAKGSDDMRKWLALSALPQAPPSLSRPRV